MKKLIAVEDKVIVAILKKDSITKGGIIIPDTAQSQEPQSYGHVISVGPKVENVKEDDVVMFNNRAGMDIIIDNTIHKVLILGEIYCIVESKTKDEKYEYLTLGKGD